MGKPHDLLHPKDTSKASLIHSMPMRVEAVIVDNGGYINLSIGLRRHVPTGCGERGKIHFYGWPYRGSERVKCHRSLPMKVQMSYTPLSNHLRKKSSSLQPKSQRSLIWKCTKRNLKTKQDDLRQTLTSNLKQQFVEDVSSTYSRTKAHAEVDVLHNQPNIIM
ncbi:hypothetical protein TNCV_5097381 [Trichonephila clavipes]|nr:hypothetical protein TNCV_5097381 [Trichonephila clavipes]